MNEISPALREDRMDENEEALHRNQKCQRLAATGFGCSQHIVPAKSMWDGRPLDGLHVHELGLFQPPLCPVRQREPREILGSNIRLQLAYFLPCIDVFGNDGGQRVGAGSGGASSNASFQETNLFVFIHSLPPELVVVGLLLGLALVLRLAVSLALPSGLGAGNRHSHGASNDTHRLRDAPATTNRKEQAKGKSKSLKP